MILLSYNCSKVGDSLFSGFCQKFRMTYYNIGLFFIVHIQFNTMHFTIKTLNVYAVLSLNISYSKEKD